MLIKAFPHGRGGGSSPIEYLLRRDYHGRKENPPEVLRGDPILTRDLIDSIAREWKFTSGVCSWSGEDTVTSDQQQEVMDRFEEVAFAGLEPDQYNILWVRHSHTNRCELHFVIPRIELSTGNAFNAFPPGWQKDFDPLRDYENIKYGWTRPDDPERSRMFTPSNADILEARLSRWGQNPTKEEKEKARDVINGYVKDQIESGIIHNRSDIIISLREIGLTINRESKNFITVMDSETNEKIRLKGGVYNAEWKSDDLSRKAQNKSCRGTNKDRRDICRELEEIKQTIAGIIGKRAEYNRKRYQNQSRRSVIKSEQILQNSECSSWQRMDTHNNTGNSDDDRNNYSFLGSISGTGILGESKDGRTGRDSSRDTRAATDPISSEEEHIRHLSENEQKGEVYSASRQCENRNQLDEWRKESNSSDRGAVIFNNGSTLENNSVETKQGGIINGKDRNRNNSNGNYRINRDGYKQVEGVRKPKNFRFAESIQRSLGAIREIGRLTREITKSIVITKLYFIKSQQTLKQKSHNHGIER